MNHLGGHGNHVVSKIEEVEVEVLRGPARPVDLQAEGDGARRGELEAEVAPAVVPVRRVVGVSPRAEEPELPGGVGGMVGIPGVDEALHRHAGRQGRGESILRSRRIGDALLLGRVGEGVRAGFREAPRGHQLVEQLSPFIGV